MIPNWYLKRPVWTKETVELFLPKFDYDNSTISLSTILSESERFPCEFATNTNRCKTLKQHVNIATLERNINSAYPIIHENILNLYAKFLLYKRIYGTTKEKLFYNSMNLIDFINRLLTKRAVTFLGKMDHYLLLDGTENYGNWEIIGSENDQKSSIIANFINWIIGNGQTNVLSLEKCLSYDEIKLSAFLSISSYSYFINNGVRKNFGKYEENRTNIQDEGIIIGMIGPRLTKEEVMEYQEIILSERQNCKEKGYGKNNLPSIPQLFAEFYEENCLEFNQIPYDQIGQRYIPLDNNLEMFDNHLYYKRLVFSIDTLFMEANKRALDKATMAYIHVVGFSLGTWRKTILQDKIFLDTCAQRIDALGSKLKHVSDICFAYIQHDSCGGFKDGDKIPIDDHPNQGITIYLRNREPHTRLTGDDSEKLLVVSYAWNGNAFPGNEYWSNRLGDSSDSAAACSTQITELHNPLVNPKICAGNLRIVTDKAVLTLSEYVQELSSKF